jgi:hypothetical protein
VSVDLPVPWSRLLIVLFTGAFWDSLYKNKGGEAQAALDELQSLAKERDSTVAALTLTSVDDMAEDVEVIKGEMFQIKGGLSDGFEGLDHIFRQEVGVLKNLLISHLPHGVEQSEPKPTGW